MGVGEGEGTGVGVGVGVGATTGVGAGVGATIGAGVGEGATTGAGVGVGVGAGVTVELLLERVTLEGGVFKLPGAELNPKVTLPPTGMMLFQETGRNSERLPLRVWLASHTLVGTLERSIATDQLSTGEEVVFTNLMLPVIPVPQSETTRNSTRTPSIVKSALGDPLTEGAGVGCGAGVGVATGVGWGVGVGVA